MKKLLTIAFLFISFTAICQKDTTKKTTVEVPLEFKVDTAKYKRVMYVDKGYVKVDSATIITSGYGSNLIQGFWNKDVKYKVFIGGREFKPEDILQVISQ